MTISAKMPANCRRLRSNGRLTKRCSEYANSLMLDFRTVIIPRFVYATGNSFSDDAITDPKIKQRIEQVAAELIRVTSALRG